MSASQYKTSVFLLFFFFFFLSAAATTVPLSKVFTPCSRTSGASKLCENSVAEVQIKPRNRGGKLLYGAINVAAAAIVQA